MRVFSSVAFLFAEIPDADGLIEAAGGDPRAIGRKGDGVDAVGGLGERVKARAGGHIPDFHRAVRRAGDEPLAVGREGQGVDGVDVVAQGANFLAGGDVPELDELVVAGGGEGRAVGRKRDGVDAIGVAGDGGRHGARRRRPRFSLRLCGRADRQRRRAVCRRAKTRRRGRLPALPRERRDGFFRVRVDQPRFFIAAERDRRAIGRPGQRVDLARRRSECDAGRESAPRISFSG